MSELGVRNATCTFETGGKLEIVEMDDGRYDLSMIVNEGHSVAAYVSRSDLLNVAITILGLDIVTDGECE